MSGSNPGSAVNSGSSASARLIFTVPQRVRQCSMSSTNVVGSCDSFDLLEERDLRVDRGDDERRRQLLAAVERDADARGRRGSGPARPRAFVRISAPNDCAAAAHASPTAPMPPSG